MICSKEDFLLVLSNWMSSSQRVVVAFLFGESSLFALHL